MTAFDIAGAAVWTPVALLLWAEIATAPPSPPNLDAGYSDAIRLAFASALAFAAVFCIARLFGASM